MMKNKMIFMLIFFYLLVGAGCQNNKNNNNQSVSSDKNNTITNIEVKKKPETSDSLNAANEFCEQKDNIVATKYNKKTKKTEYYCLFENDTACQVMDFYYGDCSKEKKALPFADNIGDTLGVFRSCDEKSLPVCGKDYKNYANKCAAEINNIDILHDGLCTEKEQANLENENIGSTTSNVPATSSKNIVSNIVDAAEKAIGLNNNSTTKPVAEEKNYSWLNLVTGFLLSEEPKSPRAYVSKCNSANQGIVFYAFSGGNEGMSMFYNEKGQLLCYPNNMTDLVCQDLNILSKNSSKCVKIWSDNR